MNKEEKSPKMLTEIQQLKILKTWEILHLSWVTNPGMDRQEILKALNITY